MDKKKQRLVYKEIIILITTLICYTGIVLILLWVLGSWVNKDTGDKIGNRNVILEMTVIFCFIGVLLRIGLSHVWFKFKLEFSGEICIQIWIICIAILAAFFPLKNIKSYMTIYGLQFIVAGMVFVPERFTGLRSFSSRSHRKISPGSFEAIIFIVAINISIIVEIFKVVSPQVDSIRLAFSIFILAAAIGRLVRTLRAKQIIE